MSSSSSESSDAESDQRKKIRGELSTMTFEEILKLKEELGAKVYKETVLGIGKRKKSNGSNAASDFKRSNKNRPREISSKRQVPFLGAELRTKASTAEYRDPRFDENSGIYDAKNFKDNYKFLSEIRQNEVFELRKQLRKTDEPGKRQEIKQAIQRLVNKNNEETNWHTKQATLKEEKKEIDAAHAEGKQPHYLTKKERRAKELVTKFEELKKTGKLSKHIEKRRKKNAAKDRKRMNFD